MPRVAAFGEIVFLTLKPGWKTFLIKRLFEKIKALNTIGNRFEQSCKLREEAK